MRQLTAFANLSEWLADWNSSDRPETRIGLVHALGHVPYPGDTKFIHKNKLKRTSICIEQAVELESQLAGQERPDQLLRLLLVVTLKFALGHLQTMRHNHEAMRQTYQNLIKQKKMVPEEPRQEHDGIQDLEVKVLQLLENKALLGLLPPTKEFAQERHNFLEQLSNKPFGPPFVSWYNAAVANGFWDLLPSGDLRSIEALRLYLSPTREGDSREMFRNWFVNEATAPAALQYLKHLALSGGLLASSPELRQVP